MVSVSARITETGFDELSLIRITLRFAQMRPGLRWTIVASGQYEIPTTAPLAAYCVYRSERIGDAISCPADDVAGAADVHYGRAGLAVVNQGRAYSISDYDGYDPQRLSMVHGGIAAGSGTSGGEAKVQVWLPIRTPRWSKAGSQIYGALAPIAAYNRGDFGSGALLQTSPTVSQGLVDDVTGAALKPAAVTDVTLDVDLDLGFGAVTAARPALASADRLRWTGRDISAGTIRFSVHDPIAETHILRRTFLAGITGGIAVNALVLLLDRITRPQRRDGISEDG